MAYACVVRGKPELSGGGIDPRRVRVPDQMAVSGVLHHDHPDVLEVLEVAAVVCGGCGADGAGQGERYDRKSGGERKDEDASQHEALLLGVAAVCRGRIMTQSGRG